MTSRKQSAHARREAQRLQSITTSVDNNTNTTLNTFINNTTTTIHGIQTQLNTTTTLNESVTNYVNFQANSLDPTSWESRITELENNPSGGGGGIDPTDPDQPILIWDNFLNQGNGDESGTVMPYPFFGSPRPTSSQVLTPSSLQVFEAASETNHIGIVQVVLPQANTYGILSLVNSPGTNSFSFADFNIVYFIIKTESPTDNYNIKLGLFDDVDAPSQGIFLNGTKGANWVPTVNDGTTATGATTALANNTWYTIKIQKKTSTSVGFTINGGTEVVLSTNVPTGYLTCGVRFENTTALPTEDISFLIDFFSLKLKDTGILSPGTTVEGTVNEVEVTTVGSVITVGLPSAIIVSQATVDKITFIMGGTSPTLSMGELAWDPDHNGIVYQLSSTIHAPLGTSVYQRVHNSSGVNIVKGEIVYVSGSQGIDRLLVAKAKADAEATSAPTVGVAAEDIITGSDGYIVTYGLLTQLTTTGYTAGDRIYLSETTAGAWRINSIPSAPNHGTFVGWVVKVAGGGAGSIFVKIHNYNELSELSDVYIPSNPSNNDVLQWTNANSRWENKSLSSAGIAAASHTHGNITNAGAIGSTSGLPIITTTSGVLTTGTFSTTAGTFCEGNDARLLSNGDKGDITLSGSPAGSTWTIDNQAVTYTKMQNISTNNRLLGRSTAGAGSTEEITVGSGLSLTGGTLTSTVTATTPGGSTGQVQYNNASAFAGATNVKINSNNLELVKPSSEPTTAPVDSIIMYAKDFGQRDLPAFVDSSGWSTNLQTCIARNKFTQFNFNGNTNTAATTNGMVITTTSVGTAGTAGGAVALTTTSILGGSRRQSYLTSATAGSATGWRASVAQCWRGNAAGRGGFFCVWKFGIGDAVLTAGGTLFVGLNDSTAAPALVVTQNPRTTTDNTMRNQVGLVLADGSLVYQICHRNGTAAATTISTGVTANLVDIIEFCLYCAPNDSNLYYYMKVYADSGSNTEISGTMSGANIPVNTTQFVPHMWRGNNLSATALAVHALSFSIETPH